MIAPRITEAMNTKIAIITSFHIVQGDALRSANAEQNSHTASAALTHRIAGANVVPTEPITISAPTSKALLRSKELCGHSHIEMTSQAPMIAGAGTALGCGNPSVVVQTVIAPPPMGWDDR